MHRLTSSTRSGDSRPRRVAGNRSGFTIIELLVVIVIFAILMALLAPAIQHARESARVVECRNKLKNLGLVCLTFHETYHSYPRNTVRPRGVTLSEEEPPGNLWNWNRGTFESWNRQIMGLMHHKSATEHDAIPELACPSDPRGEAYKIPTYGFTWYVGIYSNPSTVNNGVIIDDSDLRTKKTVSILDVTDGTSNTIMIGERHPVDDDRWGWWDSRCCIEDSISPARGENRIFSHGIYGRCPAPAIYRRGDYRDDCLIHALWSTHRGGGNFCLADGSVRTISYDSGNSPAGNSTLLEILASRAGHEIVGSEP